jgi:hypothetical protein
VISPTERARVLDAEMQLQRAWLELSLRDLSAQARGSPWAAFDAVKLGRIGLSLLKHRSLWLAAISLLVNFYRRHSNRHSKEKS